MFLLNGRDLWQGVISRRGINGRQCRVLEKEFVYDHITVRQSTESNDVNTKEVLALLIPI